MTMKPTTLPIITAILLSWTGVSGQTVNYFGFDPNYNLIPRDILKAQNGDLILFSSVNWAGPLIENFEFKRYLVRTDSDGGLLWQNYVGQPWYAGGNLVEMSGNGFFVFGENEGGAACGFQSSSIPYRDYSVQMYSSMGDSVSTTVHSDFCEDDIRDFIHHNSMSYALVRSQDQNYVNHFSIKEIDVTGAFVSTPIPALLQTGFRVFERASDGYWFAGSGVLYKTDWNGSLLWQQPMSLPAYVSDLLRVNNDSLLYLCSSQDGSDPDTMVLVKSDALGNVDWQVGFPAKSWNIMQHSSGVYVVSGKQSNKAAVVAINPLGNIVWSRITPLSSSGFAIKTIELSDGRLATLAYSGGWGQAGQMALILDTLYATLPPCSANFELFEDALPYHYIAVNQATAYDSIVQYYWDWGDGTIASGPYPEHTYNQPATYNICLTITTESGCTDTYCDDLTFKSPVQLYHVNVVPPTAVGVGDEAAFPIEEMTLYPNPSDGQLLLSGRSSYDGNLRLEVINALGHSVIRSQIEVQRGDFAREFNLNLNPGLYHMIVRNEKGVKTLPFSVIGR